MNVYVIVFHKQEKGWLIIFTALHCTPIPPGQSFLSVSLLKLGLTSCHLNSIYFKHAGFSIVLESFKQQQKFGEEELLLM